MYTVSKNLKISYLKCSLGVHIIPICCTILLSGSLALFPYKSRVQVAQSVQMQSVNSGVVSVGTFEKSPSDKGHSSFNSLLLGKSINHFPYKYTVIYLIQKTCPNLKIICLNCSFGDPTLYEDCSNYNALENMASMGRAGFPYTIELL